MRKARKARLFPPGSRPYFPRPDQSRAYFPRPQGERNRPRAKAAPISPGPKVREIALGRKPRLFPLTPWVPQFEAAPISPDSMGSLRKAKPPLFLPARGIP
jgi:hypothetical protein